MLRQSTGCFTSAGSQVIRLGSAVISIVASPSLSDGPREICLKLACRRLQHHGAMILCSHQNVDKSACKPIQREDSKWKKRLQIGSKVHGPWVVSFSLGSVAMGG